MSDFDICFGLLNDIFADFAELSSNTTKHTKNAAVETKKYYEKNNKTKKPARQSSVNRNCKISDLIDDTADGKKRIIIKNPNIIVFWKDRTVTTVRCSANDTFDTEKGLAMAILKKLDGNTGRYYRDMEKLIDKAEVVDTQRFIRKKSTNTDNEKVAVDKVTPKVETDKKTKTKKTKKTVKSTSTVVDTSNDNQ